jgi:ABC-2 type transport system ATP-binding protein
MIPILLENVSKSFVRKAEVGASGQKRESRRVLANVALQVGEGEIVCVIGKNGTGKTTLIRILSTLVEPDLGLARICGFDVMREPNEVRKRIGVMLNSGEGGFHPRLSALATLEYYGALYKMHAREARSRARQLLKDLGLEDRGVDQYQSYSTGMRRRLALIRAFLPDTPVLLLDEPTMGVDPWSTEQIHNSLHELSKRGKTILCMTNNPMEARALGDRCYILQDGALLPSKAEEVMAA